MIKYIKGTIEDFGLDYIVIENNGLGYKINTSQHSIEDYYKIGKEEKILINTEMVVREDDISLFGFSTAKELEVFNLLRGVSRIGAKKAIGILSYVDYNSLIAMIKNGDINGLTKAKGIGKKTAKRILLNLQEKMKKQYPDEVLETMSAKKQTGVINSEAVDALVALGYTEKESEMAVSAFENTGLSVEEIIKKALSYV